MSCLILILIKGTGDIQMKHDNSQAWSSSLTQHKFYYICTKLLSVIK